MTCFMFVMFCFSSRRRHTRCALVTGVQTCALPIFDREEIQRAGFGDLGEALRALPQNFSGGQNPGVGKGARSGANTNDNVTGGSSVNLRGLGPDATLTLLNGHRLSLDRKSTRLNSSH